MTSSIPYIRDFKFVYGKAERISANVRRLTANNPGPFTGWGTNVYLVGESELAIIDPGPDTDDHFEVLLKAVGTKSVSNIFVTHHHRDHSPMAPRLGEHFKCQTIGFGSPLNSANAQAGGFEEADHADFVPDVIAQDKQVFTGDGWWIKCLHTPGHTSNHMCYAVIPDNGLICGDHVLAWSTSVVIPPDGNMADYMSSLALVKQQNFAELWPGHGPAITDPKPFLEAYIQHRMLRDQQILLQLQTGPKTIKQLVPIIYADIDIKLYPAASISMLSHLIRLCQIGQVKCDGKPGLGRIWSLAQDYTVQD